jgi:hypothetical protein
MNKKKEFGEANIYTQQDIFVKIVKGPGPVHFVGKKNVNCHKIVEKKHIIWHLSTL